MLPWEEVWACSVCSFLSGTGFGGHPVLVGRLLEEPFPLTWVSGRSQVGQTHGINVIEILWTSGCGSQVPECPQCPEFSLNGCLSPRLNKETNDTGRTAHGHTRLHDQCGHKEHPHLVTWVQVGKENMSFPIATCTNYHQHSNLSTHRFAILWFWMSEDQGCSRGAEIHRGGSPLSGHLQPAFGIFSTNMAGKPFFHCLFYDFDSRSSPLFQNLYDDRGPTEIILFFNKAVWLTLNLPLLHDQTFIGSRFKTRTFFRQKPKMSWHFHL